MTNTSWSNLKTAMESVMTSRLPGALRLHHRLRLEPIGRRQVSVAAGDAHQQRRSGPEQRSHHQDALRRPAFPPNSTQTGVKFESPASESIGAVAQALVADTSPGSKYIIFLTDGQPDYCDDSNSLCAPDSVVYQLQKAYTAGITTVVFGVQTSLFDLAPGVLQAFANAGAGEPTLAPVKTNGTANDFYDQCNGIAGWAADLTASGKPSARGTTLGTYDTTMGPTKPYMPSASDQTMLVSNLSAALSGVKSCTFDLSDVGGKSIKVDTMKLAQAQVKIMGTVVPQDATNGWNVASSAPTQLVLSGDACATWRMPGNTADRLQLPLQLHHLRVAP